MKTTLVHPDGREWELDDMPIVPRGVLLHMPGKFTSLRVIDCYVGIYQEGDKVVYKQRLLLSLMNMNGSSY